MPHSLNRTHGLFVESSLAISAAALAVALLAPSTRGQCMRYLPEGDFWTGSTVEKMVAWDRDGDGIEESLVVVGQNIRSFGGQPGHQIAVWDGHAWDMLGGFAFNKGVTCVGTFDVDGPGGQAPQLFVGGAFTQIGTENIAYMARWDGNQWRSTGPGIVNWVLAMQAHDPDGPGPAPAKLYAAAGGVVVQSWDGTAWDKIGSSLRRQGEFFEGATPRQLIEYDFDGDGPDHARLIVTGDFWGRKGQNGQWNTPPGGVHWAAYFDGVDWQAIAPNVPGFYRGVYSIASYDPDPRPGSTPELYINLVDDAKVRVLQGGAWELAPGLESETYVLGMFVMDHDGEDCTVDRMYFGGLGCCKNLRWWDGALVVTETAIASERSHITRFDPDGRDGEPPQIILGNGNTSGDGWRLKRHQVVECPPVMWEIASSAKHEVWQGPVFSENFGTGTDLSAVQGSWEWELDTPTTYQSYSTTLMQGAWGAGEEGTMATFRIDGSRHLAHCGGAWELHTARSNLTLRGWTCGSASTPSLIARHYEGSIDLAPHSGLGDRVSTTAGGLRAGVPGESVILDASQEPAIVRSTKGRRFAAFPGVDFNLAIEEVIDEVAQYECVFGTWEIQGWTFAHPSPARLGSTVTILADPQDTTACTRGNATFGVQAVGTGQLVHRWQVRIRDGVQEWRDVSEGFNAGDDQVPAFIASGADTATIEVQPATTGWSVDLEFRCVVESLCTSAASAHGDLIVCRADADCSGFVDLDDYITFVGAFEHGLPEADFDGTGFVDTDDFTAFVLAFEAGC